MATSGLASTRISAAAVKARTGRDWSEWFAILDAADATRMSHREIAAYLVTQHQVPAWWSQTITVAYEQARSLRERYETPSGYQVSVSKTLNVPVVRLFAAWNDEAQRKRWLPDGAIAIRKTTPGRSIRATWVDGKSSLDVNFYAKGETKSQVALEHGKLANGDEVERMRAYWSRALEALKRLLEA